MNFVKKARETVAMYESIGGEAIIELRHLLGVIIGSKKATPELMGKLTENGVHYLANMTVQELEVMGLSHLEALRLHASLLLTKKLSNAKQVERYIIKSPEDGADYLMEEMRSLKQEHLVVLFLNTKNEIIHKSTVFIGSLNASIVHPREIFREAVKRSSASIIVGHNHPSGDPTPSQEDIHVTRRLAEAGKIMGIDMLDHLIIGNNRFISLKEKGYL